MAESNVVTLSRYRADLSRALARRGQDILAADDVAAAVQALEPLEAYFIAKELGVEEAVPLLLQATPEQLQAFVDLDCWSGDKPAFEDLDAWLAPFAAEGPEALATVFLQLDYEMQVLFLGSGLVIYDARSEDIPEAPSSVTRVPTTDGFFLLEPLPGEREVPPLTLVDALYQYSSEEAFQLLTAAKWEASAETEDLAYHFRSARVQELGFPSAEVAARLFTRPPEPLPELAVSATPPPVSLPALYARPLAEDTLLTRALARIAEAAAVERLERDLVYLVNAAVVGYGEATRDVAHAAEIAGRVRDTVSLGLEVLLSPSGPHPELESDATAAAAADLLRRYHLRDLFRVGHARVASLAEATRALAADPVFLAWVEATHREGDEYSQERRDRELVRALLRTRPLRGGFDPLAPERVRAFASLRELQETDERLDAISKRYL